MFESPGALAITGVEFEAIVDEKALVFVDFWAPWCASCLPFGEVFNEVAIANRDISFVKINIEEERLLAESFHIQSIPHIMVLKLGIVIYSASGSMSHSTLVELVKQARDADVSELKAQIEKIEEE